MHINNVGFLCRFPSRAFYSWRGFFLCIPTPVVLSSPASACPDFSASFFLLHPRDRQHLGCLPLLRYGTSLSLFTLCLLFEAAFYLHIQEHGVGWWISAKITISTGPVQTSQVEESWDSSVPHLSLPYMVFMTVYKWLFPVTDNQILKVISQEPTIHELHSTH